MSKMCLSCTLISMQYHDVLTEVSFSRISVSDQNSDWKYIEHAVSNLRTSLSHILVICHLLPSFLWGGPNNPWNGDLEMDRTDVVNMKKKKKVPEKEKGTCKSLSWVPIDRPRISNTLILSKLTAAFCLYFLLFWKWNAESCKHSSQMLLEKAIEW